MGGCQGLFQNEYDFNLLMTTVAVKNFLASDSNLLRLYLGIGVP